jgi:hypothetical protein
MADKYGRPSVSSLIEFLSKFPPDSVWWAYEGEVSGVIISHKTASGIAHNDGTCEGPKIYEVPKDDREV